MATEQIAPGLDADDFLEREAGGPHHVAAVLAELGSAVYAAVEEFKYSDENPCDRDLVAVLTPVQSVLERLSMTPEGHLTYWRECGRCGGKGKTRGEDPCADCEGRGAVHPEQD